MSLKSKVYGCLGLLPNTTTIDRSRYPLPAKGGDTNYQLALTKWGLRTVIEICALIKCEDPKQEVRKTRWCLSLFWVPLPDEMKNERKFAKTGPGRERAQTKTHQKVAFLAGVRHSIEAPRSGAGEQCCGWQGPRPDDQVRKRISLLRCHFYTKNDHFTKTSSG